eukprot:6513738-Pyramimonas_sp.AAC.1
MVAHSRSHFGASHFGSRPLGSRPAGASGNPRARLHAPLHSPTCTGAPPWWLAGTLGCRPR